MTNLPITTSRIRHWLNCRLLRASGRLEGPILTELRDNESLIDWLVRNQIAQDAQAAAEALIVAHGLDAARDQLLADPEAVAVLLVARQDAHA